MTQENQNTLSNVLLLVGLLVMAVMALLPLLGHNQMWMRWAFAAGAALTLVAQVMNRYTGDSLRIKRLYRIQIASALLYCASALMMWVDRGSNDWIAFMLSGAMVQIYSSWMIERLSARERREQDKRDTKSPRKGK